MTAPASVRLWLDDPKVGCGTRSFVVVAEGRAWATLLYVPLLVQLRVPCGELRRARPEPIPAQKLAAKIRARRRERKKLGLPFSQAAVRAALARLEGPRP